MDQTPAPYSFDLNNDFIRVDLCPLCGEPVTLAGLLERMPTNREICPLMGRPGSRWLICRDGDWAHFRREDRLSDGETNIWDGLAYIKPDPDSDKGGQLIF